MKELKSVNDDPEFKAMSDAVQRCQLELVGVADRSAQLELEILNIKTTQPTKENSEWEEFVAGGNSDILGVPQLTGLLEEQSFLLDREQFLNRALDLGRSELDQRRGRLSLEVCKSHRSAFADDARKILQHLKAICDVTNASRARRERLERDGVETGSIPYLLFDLGGPWDDQYGGKVAGYRRWIKENYPEISG